jgi:hypothetical protein
MAIKKKRKLFVDDGRPHGTVILNWHGTPEREFTYFAEAFRVLAQESVAKLKTDRRFGLHGIPIEDFKAYPIIFLYRHALELYMKAVLLVGSKMLTFKGEPEVEREKILKTHNLDVLRQQLERVFAVYGWGWDLGNSNFGSVKDLRTVVGEFHAIDAGSYAFRYPIDTKGAPSLEKDFQFNVFQFCTVLDDLFPTLEGAAIGAYEVYQDTLQALGEQQEYERQYADQDDAEHDYEHEYDYYEPDYEPQGE